MVEVLRLLFETNFFTIDRSFFTWQKHSCRKGMHLRYSYRILKNKQTKKTSWAICTSCSQMSDFISPDPPQVILLFLRGDLKMSVELWRKQVNKRPNTCWTFVDAIIEIKRVIISAHVSKATPNRANGGTSTLAGGRGGGLVFKQFTLI